MTRRVISRRREWLAITVGIALVLIGGGAGALLMTAGGVR
jgi:hypothetical protein